jgi:hypothetical protein
MPKYKSQGGTIGVFTLMIPEIACQKVKLSSNPKTCDMSDFALIAYNPNNAESAPSKYSVFVTNWN